MNKNKDINKFANLRLNRFKDKASAANNLNEETVDDFTNVKKIKLVSNCLSYGPEPRSNDEIEQHLTINNDGKILLVSYVYGDGHKYHKSNILNFRVQPVITNEILTTISDYFTRQYNEVYVTDVGSWKLTITDEDNKKENYTGPLIAINDDIANISKMIKVKLKIPALFVFDGQANDERIERLMIEYHRITKPSPLFELPIDHVERIELDRKAGKLTYSKQYGSYAHTTSEYYINDWVSRLLDWQGSSELLSHLKRPTKNIIIDPMDIIDYKITVDYLCCGQMSLPGSFDKGGLSKDFPKLAKDLNEFLNNYNQSEMLDPLLYSKIRRKKGEYIFCKIAFYKGGKTYYYLTNDDKYLKVGDKVMVPVGDDGKESLGEVIAIEYHTKENAPYPLDKIKFFYYVVYLGADNNGELGDEELVDFDRLVLCDEDAARASVYVWASLTNGCLLISGQDLGKDLEHCFGKDEYEYFYSFDKDNTQELLSLLQKDDTDIKSALVNKFGGIDGCRILRDFCEQNNIKYEFSTY